MSESNHHQDAQEIADGGPPPAPLGVPQYVHDGIGNQKAELLREIAVWYGQRFAAGSDRCGLEPW